MTKLFTRLALLCSVVVTSSQSYAIADLNTYAEGTWAVSARAGIAPTVFSKDVEITSTLTLAGTPFSGTKSSSYNDLFTLPFVAGFDIGYFWLDNLEVFANFDYSHACSEKVSFTTNVTAANIPIAQSWKTRDTDAFGFNLGLRSYFYSIDSLVFFTGAKLGIKNIGKCHGTEKFTTFANTTLGSQTRVFERDSSKNCAAFTAGFQLGLDYIFDDNFALTLMSEMIGTSERNFKSGLQIHRVSPTGTITATEITRNPRGTLSFPVTLGIRVRM